MALPATDDFNRSDGGLGSNWTDQNGSHTIASNQIGAAGGSASDENGTYWNADTFSNDQYSQAEVTGLGSGFGGAGVAVRVNTAAANSWYGYYGYNGDRWLFKMVSGSWTQLGNTSSSWSTPSTIYLEAEGTAIEAKAGGSSDLTSTDSSLTSGAAGVTSWGTSVGTTLDDWEGGDLGGGGAANAINPLLRKIKFNRSPILRM